MTKYVSALRVAQIPSAYYLADAFLFMDSLLGKRVFKPRPGYSRGDLAAEEGVKAKKCLGALRYLWRSAKGGHDEKVRDLKGYLEESPLQGRERPPPGPPMDEADGPSGDEADGPSGDEADGSGDEADGSGDEAASDPPSDDEGDREGGDVVQNQAESQAEPSDDGDVVESQAELAGDDDGNPCESQVEPHDGSGDELEGDDGNPCKSQVEPHDRSGEVPESQVEGDAESDSGTNSLDRKTLIMGEDPSDHEVEDPDYDAEAAESEGEVASDQEVEPAEDEAGLGEGAGGLVASPQLDGGCSQPGRERGGWLAGCYEPEISAKERAMMLRVVQKYLEENGLAGHLGLRPFS